MLRKIKFHAVALLLKITKTDWKIAVTSTMYFSNQFDIKDGWGNLQKKSRLVLKIRQLLVIYLIKYYLHTKKLKLSFIKFKGFLTSNLKSVLKIEWKKYPILLFEVLVQNWTSLNKFERKKSEIIGKKFWPKSCGQLISKWICNIAQLNLDERCS